MIGVKRVREERHEILNWNVKKSTNNSEKEDIPPWNYNRKVKISIKLDPKISMQLRKR